MNQAQIEVVNRQHSSEREEFEALIKANVPPGIDVDLSIMAEDAYEIRLISREKITGLELSATPPSARKALVLFHVAIALAHMGGA